MPHKKYKFDDVPAERHGVVDLEVHLGRWEDEGGKDLDGYKFFGNWGC